MPRTNVAIGSGDLGKWLAVAAAFAGVGVLPRGWQKTLSGAAAVLMLLKW